MILTKKKQFIRYIIVGVWNTLFGYSTYAILTWTLDNNFHLSHSYIYSFVLSNFISISQSFIAHKYLVFKTKGNFWKEYRKGWVVYAPTTLISLIALPFAVELFSLILPAPFKQADKYVGGAAVTGISAIASFIGHNKITFSQ